MSVADIESATEKLTPGELSQLLRWLQEHAERVWDTQIAEDIHAGRLDALLTNVDQEYEQGLARPL